jgi:hypothetical protein
MIGQKWVLFTNIFLAAAKVIHSWLRGVDKKASSPPVNNFGATISAAVLCRFGYPFVGSL